MFKKSIRTMSFILISMVLISGVSFAGQWAKTYGGSGNDDGSIVPKGDGTFDLDATTDSFGAGKLDGLKAKLTATGAVSWARTFGGKRDDDLSAMDLPDGGFFVSGMSKSFGTGNPAAPNNNIVFAKFDSAWEPVFQHVIGGAREETGYFISTKDKGFLFLGQSNSYGPSAGDQDILLMKIKSDGVPAWKKAFHVGSTDQLTDVKEQNNGFLVAATVVQLKFQALDRTTRPERSLSHILLMKLDKATGDVIWKELLGSPEGSLLSAELFKAADGNYFLTGMFITSPLPAISSQIPSISSPIPFFEILLLKFNPETGAVLLSSTYGSGSPTVVPLADNLKINPDGTIVLTGNTLTVDYSDLSETSKVLVMKLKADLSITWQKNLNGKDGIYAFISDTGLLNGYAGSPTDTTPADVLYAKLNPTTYEPVWARTFGAAGDEWGDLTKMGKKYLLSGGTESFGGATIYKANVFGLILDANGNYPNCNVKPFNMTVEDSYLTESSIQILPKIFTLAERFPEAPTDISLTITSPKLQAKNICPAIAAPADTLEKLEEVPLVLK